ncbi:DUF4328 domain-containing protein [Streptomyces sp. NPDC051940]|uniref:DUF4328 domain-containing protein n=1 Tax=Streptomyces sp. NPDC051940 TaxID=3155675 RepID=UPI0034422BDC
MTTGYAHWPGYGPRFAPPTGLASTLSVLGAVCIGAHALLAALAVALLRVDAPATAALTPPAVSGFAAMGRPMASPLVAALLLTSLLLLLAALALVLLHVVAGVVFLFWFARVRRNAGILHPAAPHRHSPGAAIGGWFVPVLNLWLPKRVTDDIWRAGRPTVSRRLVDAWWAVSLGTLASGVTTLAVPHHLPWFLVTEVLAVGAGVLTLVLVWRLTFRQNADHAAATTTFAYQNASVGM